MHSRVLTLDLPGHGLSDKPDIRYDLRLFGRAVRAVMDAAGMERAVLIGHSMGAAIIRQFYSNQPQRVVAMVSVDGMILDNPSTSFLKRQREWADSLRGPSGKEVRRKFIENMFTSATSSAIRQEMLTKMLAIPDHVAASSIYNAFASPMWNNPAPVKAPVLAINMPAQSERIRQRHEQAFPRLEYHELDGAGHFLHLEVPERFNPLLLSFLERLRQ